MKKRKKTYPVRARHPTRQASAPVVINSGYSEGGASRTRTALKGYYPLKSSTKADVDVNLPLLRSRSTDLFYNSAVGAGAINSSRNNVIGAGLRVSPKIDYKLLGLSADQALKSGSATQFVNLTCGLRAMPAICTVKTIFMTCRILFTCLT